MTRGRKVIEELRRILEPLNKEILEHPVLVLAEEGRLPRESIRRFVVNQLYIVPHDMRSLARLLSRSRAIDEIEFFKQALDGDYKALHALRRLAGELGIDPDNPGEPDPDATAYTHYLAWLSSYASLGEAAVALIVNLPVWGANATRLGRALRERYGITETEFFELFSGPYDGLERAAEPIIERYLDMKAYRIVAKTIQHYEKKFWDALLGSKA
ncbi:MAG: TenA family transcriptional regulator [Pyrodictiaceae archaeon]